MNSDLVSQLEQERDRLKAQVSKLDAAIDALADRPKVSKQRSAISRTEAVRRVLAGSPEPLSPTQIAAAMATLGRHAEKPATISRVLNHLKNTNRVVRAESGGWSLAG